MEDEKDLKKSNLDGQEEQAKPQEQAKEVKPKPELSEEAIRERQFLSGMLIQQTDDLVEEQEIVLRSGAKSQ
jgi:hypothetical protein